MSEQVNARGTLDEWVDAVRIAFDIEHEVDRNRILDLAREVAHNVARPAAPLTAYLLGLAQGAGTAPPDAVDRLRTMAGNWGTATKETMDDR